VYRPYKQPAFMPSREEMVALMRKKLRFTPRTETVQLLDALHRVCAGDVFAQNTLPNRPVSQMDGIAVRFSDFADGLPDTGKLT